LFIFDLDGDLAAHQLILLKTRPIPDRAKNAARKIKIDHWRRKTSTVHSLSHTTFDKSGHRAPHWSFKVFACLRGQSAVISSDQSNSFCVYPVAHNQPINTILAGASALVTSDAQHGQLSEDVAECDRAVARHHNHPSTCNARSICAVAISISDFSLVCAAFSNSSAAKSQCGRVWRHGLIRPTKRAASSNVANSAPGPPVGSITRVSASLKSQAGVMRTL
jgi:hypothetical protein